MVNFDEREKKQLDMITQGVKSYFESDEFKKQMATFKSSLSQELDKLTREMEQEICARCLHSKSEHFPFILPINKSSKCHTDGCTCQKYLIRLFWLKGSSMSLFHAFTSAGRFSLCNTASVDNIPEMLEYDSSSNKPDEKCDGCIKVTERERK